MDEKIPLKNNRLYIFGPFRMDVSERRLLRDGSLVPLARKVFDLLLILVEAAGHLKTREELIAALWPKAVVEEHGLTSKMSALRKALGDEEENPRYIETLRGQGYRFIAPVAMEEATSKQARDTPHRRWMWVKIGAALLALIVVAGVLAWHFASHGPTGESTPTPAPTIAVLPFENLSTDQANAYFAAGIQDTILSKLAAIGELRVISRTSTEQYPSHPMNLKRVAAQLGVTSVLEGSVQKAGNRVLINVQLIDAKTNDHIWAQVYTRSLADVFAVENDVATQVAAALQAKLLPAEAARLALAPTRDPQAYDLFLKANYFADQVFARDSAENPVASMTQAIVLYRQALVRDPNFALAYAHLSLLESRAYWYGLDRTPQRISVAERAAKHALALDPALPQAHLAIGYAEYYGHRNYAAALLQFEQAAQGLPNNADVIAAIAFIHRRQGKWQEALEGLQQAAVLDRGNPLWFEESGVTLMALRRYAQANQQFNRALAIEPYNYNAMVSKARALLLAGKQESAHRALAEIPHGVDPQGLVSGARFEAAWLAREPNSALAALANAPVWVQGMATVGNAPKSLLEAEAWAFKGDNVKARKAYEDANAKLQAALRHQPDSPALWSTLGLVEAGLGEKPKALAAGLHTTKLLPVSKDAFDGPVYLTALAQIYAQLNEPKQAVKLLRQLLAMPAGRIVSVPLLKHDPVWDPIRNDLSFQSLLKEYTNKVPIPITAAANVSTTTAE